MNTVSITTIEIEGKHLENVELEVPDNLKVLEEGDTLSKYHHIFRVINQKDGDKRLVWDSRSLPEINDARDMFNKLVEKHLRPYKVDPKGKKSPEIMEEFDPAAEEVIFAPDREGLLVGG